jgi:hypothetical protein
VLRGLVADWPIVAAAGPGDEALAELLRAAAMDEPFEAVRRARDAGDV